MARDEYNRYVDSGLATIHLPAACQPPASGSRNPGANPVPALHRMTPYVGPDYPTIASEVTPETPVAALNLNWRERDLPEKERTKHVHRLHPYLGKFVPQLAEVLLRKYFAPGQTVLDPFCGSGTTLVQANELGIHAVGYDVSAFNVLLCRVKTDRYTQEQVRNEVLDILEKVGHASQDDGGTCALLPRETPLPEAPRQRAAGQETAVQETVMPRARPEAARAYLQAWFAPPVLQQLLAYRQLIASGAYTYPALLQIILSRAARSARLATHFQLDFPQRPQVQPYWCYKHARECHPTTDAIKFLRRYSFDTLRRLEAFAVHRTSASITIHHADSRRAVYPRTNGVITSPPYVGLIDYHEQHAYAYHLLGLEDKRTDEIGPAAGGSSQAARQRYQQAIAGVLRRAAWAMPSGSRLLIIAADKASLYDDIASLAGLEPEDVLQRHVDRRTGMRSSTFYESIFIWRKP